MSRENTLKRSLPAPEEASAGYEKRSATGSSHQACTWCKRRKSRCDAARPRCSYCATHDKQCVFPPLYKRATCSQAHVEELESRLSEYETRYGRQSAAPPASTSTSNSNLPDTHYRHNSDTGVVPPAPYSPSTETVVNVHNCPPSLPEAAPTQRTTFISTRRAAGTDFGQAGSGLEQQHQSARSQNHYPAVGQSSGQAAVPRVADSPVHAHLRPQKGGELMNPRPTTQATQAAAAEMTIDSDSEGGVHESDFDITFTDGMVEYVGSSPGDMPTGDGCAFDTSSTVDFALKIQASTLGKPGPARVMTTLDNNNNVSPTKDKETKLVGSTQGGDNWMALKLYLNHTYLRFMPQRVIASALLDRYFSAVNPVWPFLVEAVTRQRLDAMFSSDEPPKSIWMSQVNLAFALACQFYESETEAPLSDIYDAGKDFYLRGQGFVIAHASDTCNITMLQNLLLVIQYQQGTMRSNECWLTTGHATRMALGLGIHPASTSVTSETHGPVEDELRKRLWWGCFSLDRICSMVYGRPIGIPSVRTPSNPDNFPRAVDDRFIALGLEQPEHVPSINAFFVSSVNLYRVMDEIIQRLHGATAASRAEPGGHLSNSSQAASTLHGTSDAVTQLSSILQLDGLLQGWHHSLPRHLRFSLDGIDDPDLENSTYSQEIKRQKVILKIRFLGLHALLHRQTILYLLQDPEKRSWPRNNSHKWPSLFSDDPGGLGPTSWQNPSRGTGAASPPSSFEVHLAHLSAQSCVASAELQIEMIDTHRRLQQSGAWWWDFYFVFNALCVLCGACGLRREDYRTVVTTTPARTQALLQMGVRNIHNMAVRGGPKAAQSERFLTRLMEATLDHGHNRAKSTGTRADNENATTTMSALESLPQASLVMGSVWLPSPFNLLNEEEQATLDGLEYPPPHMPPVPCWPVDQNDLSFDANASANGNGMLPMGNAVGSLLQTSFDTWAALEGTISNTFVTEHI